jgi:hypothetical protein
MNQNKLIFLSALACLTIVGMFLAAPRLRMFYLKKALYAAADSEEAAPIVRTILKSGNARGATVVSEYANQRKMCAFDASHRVVLIGDERSPEVHIVCLGPSFTLVSTGDASMDDAIGKAIPIPKTTSRRFSIGEPPRLFRGIHLVAVDEEHADFVLRPQTEPEWHRYSFHFSEGRLVASGLHDVSETELAQWQQSPDWPPDWK